MAVGKVEVNKIEVEIDTDNMIKEVSEYMVQELKKNSPKREGVYANSWVSTKASDGCYYVHNKERFMLTHFLEFGHIKKRLKGVTRVAPQPHIIPSFSKTLKSTDKYKPKIKTKL